MTGNDDEAPTTQIGTAQKFVKQSSMSTGSWSGPLQHVFGRVWEYVQASCICF